ncbi:hypothetical protein [Phenylobacterium sp. J367]|uniref:hypothetical protein n=1 Tax=Phenylobacterium sp. J367 TaxID=2898435 RepID=UPI0021510C5B|nr:hypothetical protein [Phenylobacterium sp. J367]MCR5880978.1 hypothetical protein [Phenylobacterium sp. J367]
MAESRRERKPTWAVAMAAVVAALLVFAIIFAWVQMRGAASEADLRMGPSVPELPTPRLPEAPRLPDAPIPRPQ